MVSPAAFMDIARTITLIGAYVCALKHTKARIFTKALAPRAREGIVSIH